MQNAQGDPKGFVFKFLTCSAREEGRVVILHNKAKTKRREHIKASKRKTIEIKKNLHNHTEKTIFPNHTKNITN